MTINVSIFLPSFGVLVRRPFVFLTLDRLYWKKLSLRSHEAYSWWVCYKHAHTLQTQTGGMAANSERQNVTRTIFYAYIWPRNLEGIEGTDYQERVYNRTEQLWRDAGVKNNVTHNIPSVDEILMSCGRETESWKYNSNYLFTSGNKKTCWIDM